MTLFNPIPSDIELPQLFTNPFDYTPSDVVEWSAGELMRYIVHKSEWAEELSRGKMFGVLVVRNSGGEVGVLFAFSGNLDGRTTHDYFVPPIFDLHSPTSFFKAKEREISQINDSIGVLRSSKEYSDIKVRLEELKRSSIADISQYKEFMRLSRVRRAEVRNSSPSEKELKSIITESQHQKAELKRKESKWREAIEQLDSQLAELNSSIERLKVTRQRLSQELQHEIFDNYIIYNRIGGKSSLTDIFAQRRGTMPPAGAGECAAPKLLHYAFANGLTPISMGEFWWGESPVGEVRHHGVFYPACQSKCHPILGYMLEGMELEPNVADYAASRELKTIYQDEWLAVVDKPAGMLSVKGRVDCPSVESLLPELFSQQADAKVVHRLDMDTSGILLIAFNSEVYSNLQRQFAQRSLVKEYLALLDGVVAQDSGDVDLPLSSDYEQRPRQKVDLERGKEATSHYDVISRDGQYTRVKFTPHTGRTHQLRLHSAHPQGLNAPIVGDRLYGRVGERLMLQAISITFSHPVSNERLTFAVAPEF